MWVLVHLRDWVADTLWNELKSNCEEVLEVHLVICGRISQLLSLFHIISMCFAMGGVCMDEIYWAIFVILFFKLNKILLLSAESGIAENSWICKRKTYTYRALTNKCLCIVYISDKLYWVQDTLLFSPRDDNWFPINSLTRQYIFKSNITTCPYVLQMIMERRDISTGCWGSHLNSNAVEICCRCKLSRGVVLFTFYMNNL